MQILVKTDGAGLMASWMGKTDQNHIICSSLIPQATLLINIF